MFKKVLVANRGEIALRVIRTCRDLDIPTVAVFSEVDRAALHVALADEAYCVGEAPSRKSYLAMDRILDAALRSGAEAIHPGYGFLAENETFARCCAEAGLIFIGPSPSSMALMGDKVASRKAVEAAGVPVVPGSAALHSSDEARTSASKIGYPVLLKASAGGGGKGMRVVRAEPDLAVSFREASSEAEAAFGDPTLYLEKYIEKPRHIEFQILADGQGNFVHLGERECSIQRRHQKLVEESPSPGLTSELRERMGAAALAVARAADYSNAGTVEFLVDSSGSEWEFYFLEMNTRLQVEHPVTEMVTGLDLVREQLEIARGNPLRFHQEQVRFRGAALECRIYAEDPFRNFAPSPGKIHALFEPAGLGIRNDSGVYEGFEIPLEYDPLISKLVAWGEDRAEAVRRMRRALTEYQVGGVSTTIPFFEQLLADEAFLAGELHTHFIESRGLSEPDAASEEAFEMAALAAVVDYLERAGEDSGPSRNSADNWKNYSRRNWR